MMICEIKVLFKSGVEKKFMITTVEKEMEKIVSTIDKVYRGVMLGTLHAGLSFINISEIACVDIEIIEEVSNDVISNDVSDLKLYI